jgi:hypothetical protein
MKHKVTELTNNLDDVIIEKDQLGKIVSDLVAKYRYAKNLEKNNDMLNTKLLESVSKPLKSIDAKMVKPLTTIATSTPIAKIKRDFKTSDSASPIVSNPSTDVTDGSYTTQSENEIVQTKRSDVSHTPQSKSQIEPTRRKLNFTDSSTPYYTIPYGVTYFPKEKNKRKQYIMTYSGEPITIGKHSTFAKGTRFSLTDGLLALLTSNELPTTLRKEDQEKYIKLLKLTGDLVALEKYPQEYSDIRDTRKYEKIIQPALNDLTHSYYSLNTPSISTIPHTGKGFLRNIKNANLEYVYYDDPNEICERMKLLLSAQQNGNTNPELTNEIYRIIEELREANIIY